MKFSGIDNFSHQLIVNICLFNKAVYNFSARNHAFQDQISFWESEETSFLMKRNKNEFNNSQQFHGQHSVILKSCSSKFVNYII